MRDNLVLSNLFHRPARTVVSVVGIAIGVLLILFTIGLANGTLRDRAKREANVGAEILIRASGTRGISGSDAFRLPISRVAELERIAGVSAAVPIGQTSIATTDSDAATGSRFTEGIIFDQYAELSGIKIVQGQALGASGDQTIIDSAFSQQKKLSVGSKLRMYDRDFTVVGVYEPATGARVKIPLATMQEQLGGEDKCTGVLVKVVNPAEQEAVAERIGQVFPDDQIIPTREIEEIYMNSIPALNVFLNVVIGVAAVISALIILLTMYTTVTERTRQIGIMKALGMSKTGIAWTITQEALLLSFFGVLLGVLLTIVLRHAVVNTTTMQVQMQWQLLLTTLVVGLIGGALGALYPQFARRVSTPLML